MKRNLCVIAALIGVISITSVSTAYAVQMKIRVPMVSSVTVKDQSNATASQLLIPWTTDVLGLTLPNTSCMSNLPLYAYYKKVEVDFILSKVVASGPHMDYFFAKQQKMGYMSRTNPNSLDQLPDWAQDGTYPFLEATQNVDAENRIIVQDNPGWASIFVNDPGNGVADEDIYDMHFRDKIKWQNGTSFYDVYGPRDPDPYFGYWRRYVDIWTAPGPPPTGTNNYYVVGVGGNY